ncbi:MAG TPA: hypothetical protein DCY53_01835 [Desulfobacteraceae bacterium]|nr:hypothetical protein [Desulfobacteraceae bacterium]
MEKHIPYEKDSYIIFLNGFFDHTLRENLPKITADFASNNLSEPGLKKISITESFEKAKGDFNFRSKELLDRHLLIKYL